MAWNTENEETSISINGTSYSVNSTKELIDKIQDIAENDLHLGRFKVYIGSTEVENPADLELEDVTDTMTITPYDKAA